MSESLSDFYQRKEEKINHRYQEILKCLQAYRDYYETAFGFTLEYAFEKSAEDMALAINTAYWQRFEETFNKFVRNKNGDHSNIEHYKIASGIELAIVDLQPFHHGLNEDAETVNASFAIFTAMNILKEWDHLTYEQFDKTLSKDAELQKFITDHTTWLININTNLEYPVYLNAQAWALFIKVIKIYNQFDIIIHS